MKKCLQGVDTILNLCYDNCVDSILPFFANQFRLDVSGF